MCRWWWGRKEKSFITLPLQPAVFGFRIKIKITFVNKNEKCELVHPPQFFKLVCAMLKVAAFGWA
jgi:hypothetical protein